MEAHNQRHGLRYLWLEVRWAGFEEPERWPVSATKRRSVDDEWRRSESIDPDNVGDIADEGMGHRG